MINKLLEAFFRHKKLLLLPPIVIPLIVGPIALSMAPVYYESGATIWVDRATYLNYTEGGDPWSTPAQNQNNRMQELLRTRAFVLDVARRTPLASLTSTADGERKINETFGRGLFTSASGRNLLLVRTRGETPELALGLARGLVETFQERSSQERVEQASLAIAFYEGRLQEATQRLSLANENIRRYVASNPRLTDPLRSTTAAGVSAAVVDPRLMEVRHQVEMDQAEVDSARRALDEARLASTAAVEGQAVGFRVVDAPRLPTELTRERRRMLLFPVAGLLVGFGISAGLLILLVATDRTGRTEGDLAPTAWVVGVVPPLDPKKMPRKAGPDVARRAIGFVVGAALPQPRGSR